MLNIIEDLKESVFEADRFTNIIEDLKESVFEADRFTDTIDLSKVALGGTSRVLHDSRRGVSVEETKKLIALLENEL